MSTLILTLRSVLGDHESGREVKARSIKTRSSLLRLAGKMYALENGLLSPEHFLELTVEWERLGCRLRRYERNLA